MTLHHPDLDPVAELRTMAASPMERARAMPKSAYTSQAMLDREIAQIFRKEWICIGRAGALRNPGDYIAQDIAGQPVVVLRDREGTLRAMSNVCLHRMSVLLEGTGHTKRITCPYHGWTYELDGHLRGAPAMARNETFAREEMCLPQLPVENWLGWIMVSLDPDAAPLSPRLAEATDMLADFDLASYTQTFGERHLWNTNWKVLAENFMESYHLPVCHADTIGGLSKLDEMDCPPGHAAFNCHYILKDDTLDIGLAHPSNTRLKGQWRRTTVLLAVYPALMITVTPGYFWYLSLLPKGPGQVDFLYAGGLSKDFVDDPMAQSHFAKLKTLLDDVNEEDRGCVERVYRGISSELGTPGPVSHLERPNFEFAQYIASRVC